MRSLLNALLVVLLIAAFAVGTPIPAKASCAGDSECSMLKVGMDVGACGHKGEPCKAAQNCASPLQQMPAPTAPRWAPLEAQIHYGPSPDSEVASAFVPPETAPPRI